MSYKVSIFRLGYYGGDGARLMPTSPTQTFPANNQSNCDHDTGTGLVDCGKWAITGSWAVPSDAVSGVYLAMFDQSDGNGVMPYPFVVRESTPHSQVVIQTDDQTWQAYNDWGGQDLYGGGGPAPDGRAYKVSYNRPMDIFGDNGIFGAEYAMIQWVERNGYDVSYQSGIDTATRPSSVLGRKIFMSSGHDEYWTQGQWDNVVAARESGVNLAFFSGNEVFWRTRLEPSIDGSNAANRTLVTYKMTKMAQNNGIADPSGQWTGTWVDPAGAGKGGNTPPNQLTGTLFTVNGSRYDAIEVPYAYSRMRLWRDTSIASLQPGQKATFQTGTLGYEWDSDVENAVRAPGAIDLSSTTVAINDGKLLLDQGNTFGNGTATHSIVMYRDESSHALVFGSGTVQWSWGLSTIHGDGATTTEDVRMQQATLNLFADMGVQPLTRQSNLHAEVASTDTSAPTVTITSPAAGATLPVLSQATISGTAAEVGGGQLARVEVSVDGGTTWKKATGLGTWTYTWTPTATGAAQISVRAVDDSVNIGTPATRAVTVGPQQCPCTVFAATDVPGTINAGDGSSLELGAKFKVTTAASAIGVRFYKSTANTGTHTGSIWTSGGTLLATGTFQNETASGWQSLTFGSPVPLAANTTYVVSYYAPNGGYSADGSYFANKGAGLAPVQELQSGGSTGGNGVYRYGVNGGFPSSSYNDTNYWVEPVVDTAGVSSQPPTVTTTAPASNATGVALNAAVTATFSSAIDPATLNFSLTVQGGAAVTADTSYTAATKTAKLTPDTPLLTSTTYQVSVTAADVYGNAMTSPTTWTFTTGSTQGAPSCPCSLWSSSATPATANVNDSSSVELGLRFKPAIDGFVTGVRFYKGSANTGTHTGSLWSSDGTLLATGTFQNETSSGWQSLTFATPVAVTAATVYVVSYHAPNGNYSATGSYFTNARTVYPLTALADGDGGGNGLYRYGAASFPNSTYGSTNYWVDPIFATTAN
ncbi:DUF4082 domain-containing protein [Actinoplanes sp. KI2]|uniref:DUF4082 domain-containing protein n=1 Tax=Actinoplanes sp. KI2 TaxID=2983315 RepID=UPI0021D5CC6B|nr:DUF4082 domain-containing protein [Actinoplanes sp. KI2]MCU7726406.1 DUF4082 domain-containing protein [Actinoplanes sp. KI2]